MKYDRSKLMKRAHQIRKYLDVSIGEALRQAWAYIKLTYKMKFRPTWFTYTKKNGEKREALGCDLSISTYESKGTGKKKFIPTLITYYDLHKMSVRSFHISQLV